MYGLESIYGAVVLLGNIPGNNNRQPEHGVTGVLIKSGNYWGDFSGSPQAVQGGPQGAPRVGKTARRSPRFGRRVLPPCAHPGRASRVRRHPCLTRRGGRTPSRRGADVAASALLSPAGSPIPMVIGSMGRPPGAPRRSQVRPMDAGDSSKAASRD